MKDLSLLASKWRYSPATGGTGFASKSFSHLLAPIVSRRRTRRTAKSDVATPRQHTCLSRRDPHEPFHRGLVSTPDARRLRGGRGPRSGTQCFHRRLGDASILRPLAPGLEHQPAPFVLWPAEGWSGVQRQRAEEGSVGLG